MKSITVLIPTVRSVELNLQCLDRQSFRDFETIVLHPLSSSWWRKKRKLEQGLFYSLNADYNRGLRLARGKLILSYQDKIRIKPDTLERFWEHYAHDQKRCVGAVGDQYKTLDPPVKVWEDPRKSLKYGTFYECFPDDIEFSLCAIPRQAFYDVGGFDEKYDYGAAVGEKELMRRIDKAGYTSYLDQSIEYEALKHDRLTEDWDEYYQKACEFYREDCIALEKGTRKRLDFLQE
jgi:GT2 family glycosyltransferase